MMNVPFPERLALALVVGRHRRAEQENQDSPRDAVHSSILR